MFVRNAQIKAGRVLCTVFGLFLLLEISAFGQTKNRELPEGANVPKASQVSPSDSSQKKDSARQVNLSARKPLRTLGTLMIGVAPDREIGKRDWQLSNYTTMGDMLSQALPELFPLNLGADGQFNSWSAFGGSSRDNEMRFNGRRFNDFGTGTFNPEQPALEMFESVDLYYGSKAVVLGDNSSGVLLNAREVHHNSATPHTRLWYVQSGYDLGGSDGTFSQNIRDDINLTFGFRRSSSIGRFERSASDVWNIRSMLRYSPDSVTSLSFVWLYTDHFQQHNGGLSPRSQAFNNERLALPLIVDLDERNVRNDLQLTLQRQLGDRAGLNASLWYGGSRTWLGRGADLRTELADTTRVISPGASNLGARATMSATLGFLHIAYGGEAALYSSDASVYQTGESGLDLAGFSHITVDLGNALQLSGGARIRSLFGRIVPSIGGRLSSELNRRTAVWVDVSLTQRMPSIGEGTSLRPESIGLLMGQASYRDDSLSIEVQGFARNVIDPLVSSALIVGGLPTGALTANGLTYQALGGTLTGRRAWKHFVANGFVQTNMTITNTDQSLGLPALRASFSFSARYAINESIIQGGLRVAAVSRALGRSFFPIEQGWIPSAYADPGPMWNGLDLFGSARLGNAFVRASFLNALSSYYVFVPMYPQMDANFRLSFSWSFND